MYVEERYGREIDRPNIILATDIRLDLALKENRGHFHARC